MISTKYSSWNYFQRYKCKHLLEALQLIAPLRFINTHYIWRWQSFIAVRKLGYCFFWIFNVRNLSVSCFLSNNDWLFGKKHVCELLPSSWSVPVWRSMMLLWAGKWCSVGSMLEVSCRDVGKKSNGLKKKQPVGYDIERPVARTAGVCDVPSCLDLWMVGLKYCTLTICCCIVLLCWQ